jgi:GntR family transcriptional regulator
VLVIDPRSRVPVYEQIKHQIMELILVGALNPGDSLPSIRALASRLTLNVNTVKKAFQDLEADGVLVTVVGRGTFVAQTPMNNDRIRTRAAQQLQTALASARSSGLSREEILILVEEAFHGFGKEREGDHD